MRLAARFLNGSISVAGGLWGGILGTCVCRKWLYFPFISEVLSCLPFSFGWKFRHAVYKRILAGCGEDTILHFGVTIEDERTRIGRNVWVSVGTYIDYVDIGDSVLIGPHAVLLAGGRPHRFERLDIPIKDQGNLTKKPLSIVEISHFPSSDSRKPAYCSNSASEADWNANRNWTSLAFLMTER